MQYRSFADLSDALLQNLHRLPGDIDLVVGIPRSGLLAANMLALALNLPLADFEGLLAGRLLAAGRTKRRELLDRPIDGCRKILLLDDSINSGQSMREALDKLAAAGLRDRVVSCAVYGDRPDHAEVDVVLEVVPQPRMFQWNFLHHYRLGECCFDIDGVLCCDPTPEQNDDGEAYEAFLTSTRPLLVPTRRIGHLVTSRLEKHRPATEAWLKANGIEYDRLWMLDLPSAEERRRQKAHAPFKAGVYRRTGAFLFIESEADQAREIANLSGKPVLCIATQDVVEPSTLDLKTVAHALHSERRRRQLSGAAGPRTIAKRFIKGLIGRR